MKNLLKNKTILITGASGDIGLQTAIDCYNSGANLVLFAYKNEQQLKDNLGKRLGNYEKNRILIYSGDATNEKFVDDVFYDLENKKIKIDGLFNNAGDLIDRKYLEESSWELFQKTFDVSFKSAYLFTKKFLKLLNKNTSIVMMSSMTARGGKGDRSSHYGVAKSAILGFTKSLSNELAKKYGFRVNAIAPGYIKGSFHNKFTKKEVEIEHAKNNPLLRVGVPKDVSGVVLFLLSDLSSYVNGVTIDINGGSFIS